MKRFDDDEEFESVDNYDLWGALIGIVIVMAMIWLMWRQI